MNRIWIFLAFLLLSADCVELDNAYFESKEQTIKGITMVAPPEPFPTNPIPPILDVHANWVALVPYGYTRKGTPNVRYNLTWQWWGERGEGIRQSIRLAHEAGLSVLLKPQVYIHSSWVGEMDFEDEEAWREWERDYEAFIMHFAQIAAEERVAMLCVGTEYKISVVKREAFWRQLIRKVRAMYDGQIIYSANWDAFEQVPIWDAVDYVGISSYFPLTETKTPSVDELVSAWKPTRRKLRRFAQQTKKSIVFTEFGYLTVDHCAHKAWELEKRVRSLAINQRAQANAIDALFTAFWEEPYWAGGFLWKWFPNMRGHEGYPDRDYTPQGKLSQRVLTDWYANE